MHFSDHLYHVKPNCNRLEEGTITPEISTPGMICPDCGVWTGMGRVPQSCPDAIFKWLRARTDGPATVSEWQELNEIWRTCRELGSPNRLLPGDAFSPLRWRSSSRAQKSLYWPQYSSVVSRKDLFHRLQDLSSGCIVPIGVAMPDEMSSFVEWSFVYHSNVVTHGVPGNTMIKCKLCDRPDIRYSKFYEMEIQAQEQEKWIFKDNCLDQQVFLSHIFYPGFLARQDAKDFLESSDLTGTVVETIRIKNRV